MAIAASRCPVPVPKCPAAARPGLVPVATDDLTAGSVALRHRAAQRAGARAVDLDGLGHWWMLQDPARSARMLSDFWNSL